MCYDGHNKAMFHFWFRGFCTMLIRKKVVLYTIILIGSLILYYFNNFKLFIPKVRLKKTLKSYIEPMEYNENELTNYKLKANIMPLHRITLAPITKNPWIPKMTPNLNRLKPEVLKVNKGAWEVWDNFCDDSYGLNSVVLKSPAGQMSIYIHDVKVDKLISGSIAEQGSWEGDIMKLIHYFMSRDPELQFIDLGAHIGQYSLMAAKMGRQVIAVDPVYANILRLCSSINHNKFSHQIKVFYTAVSDVRTKVSFLTEKENLGGTRILVRGHRNKNKIIPNTQLNANLKIVDAPKKFDQTVIDTVLLDDLLPFVTFKSAFMKIDVESHENSVLKGGGMFFDSVDVRYVLMEWFQHATNPESAKEIIDFMKKHGYSAESPNENHTPLNYSEFSKWPLTVLWVKR